MNEYIIYFSFFGRNLKTTVSANSEEEAYEIIRNKITFYKEKTVVVSDNVDRLMRIFGMKK